MMAVSLDEGGGKKIADSLLAEETEKVQAIF